MTLAAPALPSQSCLSYPRPRKREVSLSSSQQRRKNQKMEGKWGLLGTGSMQGPRSGVRPLWQVPRVALGTPKASLTNEAFHCTLEERLIT